MQRSHIVEAVICGFQGYDAGRTALPSWAIDGSARPRLCAIRHCEHQSSPATHNKLWNRSRIVFRCSHLVRLRVVSVINSNLAASRAEPRLMQGCVTLEVRPRPWRHATTARHHPETGSAYVLRKYRKVRHVAMMLRGDGSGCMVEDRHNTERGQVPAGKSASFVPASHRGDRLWR